MASLDELLRHLVDAGGSDLVVKAGGPPRVRVEGELVGTPFEDFDAPSVAALLDGVVPATRADELTRQGETEFAHGVSGVGRFRVSAFRQRGSVAIVCHRVAPGLPSAEELGLPPVLDRLCEPGRGLVLLVGPGGSGVSTTLAALVDHVNATRACHVVTVEQPIEHLHPDKRSVVSQREVGTDTPSAAAAVSRATRQGADVVGVGVVTTVADLRALLQAAELGALVVAVVGGLNSSESLVRLIEAFPEEERRRARSSLAGLFRGALAQRLVDRADGRGQVAAFEVLLGTTKVRECIADAAFDELPRLIADGEYRGMQTVDRALEFLARDGLVSVSAAVAAADDPDEVRVALAGLGGPV